MYLVRHFCFLVVEGCTRCFSYAYVRTLFCLTLFPRGILQFQRCTGPNRSGERGELPSLCHLGSELRLGEERIGKYNDWDKKYKRRVIRVFAKIRF